MKAPKASKRKVLRSVHSLIGVIALMVIMLHSLDEMKRRRIVIVGSDDPTSLNDGSVDIGNLDSLVAHRVLVHGILEKGKLGLFIESSFGIPIYIKNAVHPADAFRGKTIKVIGKLVRTEGTQPIDISDNCHFREAWPSEPFYSIIVELIESSVAQR